MSNVKTLFENYHVIVGELEASLYVMSKYLELDMKEASLAKQVKRINACAEFLDGDQFIQVELINKRYKEFCFLTWAIQSRPEKQRKILEGIYINGQSWSNIQDELFISSSSLSRERKKDSVQTSSQLKRAIAFRYTVRINIERRENYGSQQR